MRSLVWIVLLLLCGTPLLAQQSPEEQKALHRQLKIQSLQSSLEDLRRQRDKIVVDRWEERRLANEKREEFNRKLEEARGVLEQVGERKSRLMDELRLVQGELAQGAEEVERQRSRFLTLSDQQGKLQELRQVTDEAVPLGEPERIVRFNRSEQLLSLDRDNPERIFSHLYSQILKEINWSRQIELTREELLVGERLLPGTLLRWGNVGALRLLPDTTSPVALLLTGVERNRRLFRWRDQLPLPTVEKVKETIAQLENSNQPKRLLVPVDILLTPMQWSDGGEGSDGGVKGWFFGMMEQGGGIAWVIILLSLVALLLSLERTLVLILKSRHTTRRVEKVLGSAGQSRDLAVVEQALMELPSGPVRRLLSSIWNSRTKSREEAERTAEEVLAHEIPSLEKRLGTISVLGGAAPLLGLLGTVIGMIQLFEVITRYGTSDPKLLAGGIAVALVTTQLGLMVAIPVMLIHNALANRVDRLSAQLQEYGLRMLNQLWISRPMLAPREEEE